MEGEKKGWKREGGWKEERSKGRSQRQDKEKRAKSD